MSEASASAMLVGTPGMLGERPGAVTTTLPRHEIEEALVSEPPADLVLEILRNVDGGTDTEPRTLRIEWQRADLESVLAWPDAPAITFSFDPAEIERALDEPDVEGHGLRETAVVLSIAAAAAVAGTSAAYGQPGTGYVASSHDETTLTARGIESGYSPASHEEAGLAERGIEPGYVASSHDETTFAARGIEPSPAAAVHDEVGLTERGIAPGYVPSSHDEATFSARGIDTGSVAASHEESTFTARGIEPSPAAAVHDEVGLTERGIEPGYVPATHDELGLTARGVDPGYVAATHDEATFTARGIDTGAPSVSVDTGSGFDLPSVDPATAVGVAGGLAGAGLLIAAAAFATRRREPGTA